jgi:hypothetical protein
MRPAEVYVPHDEPECQQAWRASFHASPQFGHRVAQQVNRSADVGVGTDVITGQEAHSCPARFEGKKRDAFSLEHRLERGRRIAVLAMQMSRATSLRRLTGRVGVEVAAHEDRNEFAHPAWGPAAPQ